MRLVALAQNGISPSLEAAIQNRDVPLPIFGGAAEAYVRARAPAFVAGSQTPISPRAGGAGFATSGAAAGNDSEWAMNAEDKKSYLIHFATADQDKDNIVSGPEAFAFFSSSGLSADVLRSIWFLADVGKDNKLDHEEFAIAVHLVRKIRGGSPVPSTLPEALRPQHSGAPGTPASSHKQHVDPGMDMELMSSPLQPIAAPTSHTPSAAVATPSSVASVATTTDPWQISPEEKAAYFVHFTKADADGDNFVSGSEGFHFFTASSLDADVLRQIWFLADVGQDQKLDREEFAIALHLVRLYKSGLPLPSELPASMRPRSSLPAAAAVPATPLSQSSGAAHGNEWSMTPDERLGYQAHFSKVDTDADGFVIGREAFDFFTSSGLDTSVLRSIWFLADVNKDNRLDAEEFSIALHLIRKIRGGSAVPATLPEALRISASPAAAAAVTSTPLSFPGSSPVAQQQILSYASSPTSSPPSSLPIQVTPTSSQHHRVGSQSALDLLSPGPISLGGSHSDHFSGLSTAPTSNSGREASDPLDLLPRADDVKVELEPFNMRVPVSPRHAAIPPTSQGAAIPSMSPSAPSVSPIADGWNMSNAEKTAYLGQFASADKDQDGYVSGREAFEFFTSSGLTADILRGIWFLADIDKDNRLDGEEFAIATHLVRKVRGGAAVPSTLPESLRPHAHVAPAASLNIGYSSPITSSSVSPGATAAAMGGEGEDAWAISSAERSGYLTQFATVDKDKDGYVSGREAFEFFTSSGLEANILRGIWMLADYGKDNRLDPAEFAIAVHLVRKVRGGATLPPSLPSSLIPAGNIPAGSQSSGMPPPVASPSTLGGMGEGSSFNDPWAMSAQERSAYLAQFPNTDKDGDGYVSGPEARDFFTSSGLSAETLRSIWFLADIDGDNRLDMNEFAIASHLTRKVRTGATLPSTLPPVLRPSGGVVSAATPLIIPTTPTNVASALSPQPPTPMAMPSVDSFGGAVPTHADDTLWAITPAERASYAAQFAKADGDGNGFIRGREGAAFFSQSGLDSGVLRKIWGLADVSEDGMLDREEFDIAVHLILKVRAGAALPDTLPSVLRPHAEGVPSPAMATASVTSPSISMTAALPSSSPNHGDEHKGEPNEMDLLAGYSSPVSAPVSNVQPISIPSGSPIAAPRAANFAPSSSTVSSTDDGWAMTPADHVSYVALFQSQDSDGDGYIAGREALEFFLKSGLDTPTLRSVWTLSDITSDGKLDVEEFSIAMHLIRKLRGGMPLPLTLPPSLLPATAASTASVPSVTSPSSFGLPAASLTPSSSSDIRLRSSSIGSSSDAYAAAIARAERAEMENVSLRAQLAELRQVVEQLMKR